MWYNIGTEGKPTEHKLKGYHPRERKEDIMAEKKITKREKFEMLLALVEDNEMLTDFINHEIELLQNKSSKGNAKKDEEQEAFFEVMRDIMSECSNVNGMQCGAIARYERALAFKWKNGEPTSPQRVSAMLKKLVDCGDVIKTVDKKTSLFRLA